MNKKKSRILSFATALALSSSVLPAALITAHAEPENVAGAIETYINENFDSYVYDSITNNEFIRSGKESAPEPITVPGIENITFSAGNRTGGINSFARVVRYANVENNYLQLVSDHNSSQGRGAGFTFDSAAGIPTFFEISDGEATGEVLEMSFKVKFDLLDASGDANKTRPAFNITSSGSALNPITYEKLGIDISKLGTLNNQNDPDDDNTRLVRLILDPNVTKSEFVNGKPVITQKLYMIVTDNNGGLVNSITRNNAVDGTKITGIAATAEAGVYTIDDLKVVKKNVDTGIATIKVVDSEEDTPIEGATVKIGNNITLTTDANGSADIALPAGETAITVSHPAYEYDNGDTYTGTIDVKTGAVDADVSVTDNLFTVGLTEKDVSTYPMEEVEIGDTKLTSGIAGALFMHAPKSGEDNSEDQFDSTVYDNLGNLMIQATNPEGDNDDKTSEYIAQWSVYPADKDASYKDEYVTVDENGKVSVSEGFSVDDSGVDGNGRVALYEVALTASHINDGGDYDGITPVTLTAPLYIGESDVIYYSADTEVLSHTYSQRTETYEYPSKLPMPDVTQSIAKLTFTSAPDGGNGRTGQRTWALVGNMRTEHDDDTGADTFRADPIVGLQYISDGTIIAWTGFMPGKSAESRSSMSNNPFSQQGDIGQFEHSFIYKTGYVPQTELTVIMDIDNVNKYITFLDDKTGAIIGGLPYDVDVETIDGAISGTYMTAGRGNLHVGEVFIAEYDDSHLEIVGDSHFAKIEGKTIEKQYYLSDGASSDGDVTWDIFPTSEEVVSLTPYAASETAVLINAEYTTDGKLVGVSLSDKKSVTVGTDVEIPDAEVGHTYMLWDLDKMTPLADKLTYEVSEADIPGIKIDQNGLLTVDDEFAKTGDYIITAKKNGVTKSLNITIDDYKELVKGFISCHSEDGLSEAGTYGEFTILGLYDASGDNIADCIDDADVTWASENPEIVDFEPNSSKIVVKSQPAVDSIVNVTATITKGDKTITISSSVTVKASNS
ncbi:MAG: hypothetical protein J1F01_10300 [Oscillospiraceae bacterium]|nr:hypothetical protein [Oscillospiraceae bacterium]